MSAVITIKFAVSLGYSPGDYALLFGNGGSGEINWASPIDNARYELFPKGGGVYGWGYAPWGQFRWGYAWSTRSAGWGYLPWGLFPWGYGTALITATQIVESCGCYKFGFKCYDSLGNENTGAPGEVEVELHNPPPAPLGLKKNSYNKKTDVLTRDAE